ncbi:glycosyltransferase family 4 protein [Flagellimonas marinaquae]|uniref:glycosyltransferase family 4 protein n=1 Tax=Flagellimonas marinaquae TaxID=254955 RepID=UPI0020755C40|nr:glycosyltransferase family 4 protein [Allomuricauda aquimarina]USD24834.1 glycosyltransferase family 4 protein [Allomuricauda aquimarina]
MNDSKSICLVGGEDAHKRTELAQHLIQNGFDVTILGTKKFECPNNINLIVYRLNRKFNPLSDIKTVLEYREILRQKDFDIVQTFDTKPAFLLPLATMGMKIKIARTVTGLGTIFMSNSIKFIAFRSFYKILHRIVKNKVSHTTFQNEDDHNYFLSQNLVTLQNSSLIFGSGINLKKFSISNITKKEPFTFVCVARLVYEKGIVNYLEAAKLCFEQGHHYKFLLIGPLEEESKKLNLKMLEEYSKYITWLGARKDVQELLSKSNVFVLPTFREGFSRVLLEASAMGLPSITTNVPGTREIIRDGQEGLLVGVNDSEELSKAMIKMASDTNLYSSCSRNAQQHVQQFSINQISKDYINLYKKIIKNKLEPVLTH